jgi:1-acyl-sn-glycerol-3-phosphate acyltransferase
MMPAPTDQAHRMGLERSLPWKFSQAIARVTTTLMFDLKVYGIQNVPAHGGALIVSNHQSSLDPVLLGVRLHRPLNYIAKSELFEGAVGGWLLRNVFNAFPVRQGAGDVGAVKETIQRLREGHLLNIYPEGARTTDGNIAPFQRGVALIIRRAQVPVIPTAITGSYDAWPITRRWCRPGSVRVKYGAPVALHDLAPDEIIARIERSVRRMECELRSRSAHACQMPRQNSQ